jgi:hypothetical protein
MLGNIFGAIILALIGAALLLNGYRWFRLLLPIWAFFVGAGGVTAVVSGLFGQNFFSTALACIPAVLVGLVFAVLSYLWFSLAVLFWAGTVGFTLFAGLLSALGINGWFILLVAGIVGAIAFVVLAQRTELKKFLPIFLTAGAGATMLLSAVLLLFGRPLEELNWGTVYGPLASGATGSFLSIVLWLVLTGIGIGLQSATNNRSLEVDMARYDVQRTA